MKASEQGTRESELSYYVAVPRTLVFVQSTNEVTGARELLLLRGAPDKRLWPNRYNGIGGHVHAGEDVLSAARREVAEEAGLDLKELTLRGVINIDTGEDEAGARPGVLVFVFLGETDERVVHSSREGTTEWIDLTAIYDYPLVDDLYELLPHVLACESIFYASYVSQADGSLRIFFA